MTVGVHKAGLDTNSINSLLACQSKPIESREIFRAKTTIGTSGQEEYKNETTTPTGVVVQKIGETLESQRSHKRGKVLRHT